MNVVAHESLKTAEAIVRGRLGGHISISQIEVNTRALVRMHRFDGKRDQYVEIGAALFARLGPQAAAEEFMLSFSP